MATADPPGPAGSDVESLHRLAARNLNVCMVGAQQALDRHGDTLNAWNSLAQAILVEASKMAEPTAVDFLAALTAAAEVRVAQHRIDHSSYPNLGAHVQSATELLAEAAAPLTVWETLCTRILGEWRDQPTGLILYELADDAAAAMILIARHMRTVQAESPTKGFGFVQFTDDAEARDDARRD